MVGAALSTAGRLLLPPPQRVAEALVLVGVRAVGVRTAAGVGGQPLDVDAVEAAAMPAAAIPAGDNDSDRGVGIAAAAADTAGAVVSPVAVAAGEKGAAAVRRSRSRSRSLAGAGAALAGVQTGRYRPPPPPLWPLRDGCGALRRSHGGGALFAAGVVVAVAAAALEPLPLALPLRTTTTESKYRGRWRAFIGALATPRAAALFIGSWWLARGVEQRSGAMEREAR
jgi:hypothetical protein